MIALLAVGLLLVEDPLGDLELRYMMNAEVIDDLDAVLKIALEDDDRDDDRISVIDRRDFSCVVDTLTGFVWIGSGRPMANSRYWIPVAPTEFDSFRGGALVLTFLQPFVQKLDELKALSELGSEEQRKIKQLEFNIRLGWIHIRQSLRGEFSIELPDSDQSVKVFDKHGNELLIEYIESGVRVKCFGRPDSAGGRKQKTTIVSFHEQD